MPRVANPDKVPEPILKARAKLASMNLDITKENLEKHIDPKEINALLGAMRTSLGKPGNETQKKNYMNAVSFFQDCSFLFPQKVLLTLTTYPFQLYRCKK